MRPKTAALCAKQEKYKDDRWQPFAAIEDTTPAKTVFYPGCYIDIAIPGMSPTNFSVTVIFRFPTMKNVAGKAS